MDHFLFSSKRWNNASRCELSSVHKQQATLEYICHVVLGDPPLKRVVLTYLNEKVETIKLCNDGFVYVVYTQGSLAYCIEIKLILSYLYAVDDAITGPEHPMNSTMRTV